MDAFSTAASAYMLAKELYDYYNDWKNCPNDVAELRDELLWLSKVLQIVENILHNPTLDPDVVNCVREAKVRCSSAMQELKEKLASIRKEGTSPSRLADIRARSLYPFKKSTIKRLAGAVAECLEQLETVVELLNLDNALRVADLLKAQGDELKALLGTVQKTISDQATAEQKDHAALHAQYETINVGVNALGASAAQAEESRQNKEVMIWLSPPNPKPVDIDEQEPGTNAWFLESPAYQSWQTDQTSALFIHGGMGCGKSVLLAAIENDLRQAHQPAHVMTYCFSGESQDNANLNGWLRFLVSRLSPPAQMHPKVLALWKAHRAEPPKSKDLKTCVHYLLGDLGTPCYILVDALDEIPKGQLCVEILTFLQDLSDITLSFHHVICTGRPHPKICATLEKHGRFQLLGIPSDANRLDVERYVTNQIERIPDLQAQSDATKSRILSRLVGEGPAMFRLAVLQMRTLESLQPLIEDSIIDTLESLPSTLEETYTRILLSINQQKSRRTVEYAQAALNWLTFTRSVLSVDQMIDAIAVNIRPNWDWKEGRRQFRAESLLELLPDLVKISGDPGGRKCDKDGANAGLRITFSHFSVKEYLLSDVSRNNPLSTFALSPYKGHKSITDTCLAYLYMTNSREESRQYYPLRSYALDNWRGHTIDFALEQHNDANLMTGPFLCHENEITNLASCAFLLTVDTIFGQPELWNRDETAEMPDVTTRKSEAMMIPFFRPHSRHLTLRKLLGVPGNGTFEVLGVNPEEAWVLSKWRDETGPEPDKVSCLPVASGSRDYVWCESHWLSGRSECFLIVCRDSVDCEFDLLRIDISVRTSSTTTTPVIYPTNASSFQLSFSTKCTTLPKVLLPRTVAGLRHRFCLSRTWRYIVPGPQSGVKRSRSKLSVWLVRVKRNMSFRAIFDHGRKVRFMTDDDRNVRFMTDHGLFNKQSEGLRLLCEAWERSDRQASQNDPTVVVSSRLMVACQQCVDCYDMFRCWCCDDCGHCTNCTDCSKCQECTECTSCIDCVGCTRSRDCADCSNCMNSVGCTNCNYCGDCVGCINCKYCRNCADCKNCVGCTDCAGCDGLTGVTGWWKNQDPSGMQLVLYSPVRHFN
jgi:hypothetical protein